MKIKTVIGILVVVCGIAGVVASQYIMNRVEEGKGQVEEAQNKVDQGQGLFSLNPITKQIGKGATDAAQKKIDEGSEQIAQYTKLADQLQIGGMIAIVLGGCVILIGKRKK